MLRCPDTCVPSHTLISTVARTLIAASLCAGFAPRASTFAGGACDDRVPIENPERFPFDTICTLRYDADYDGILGAVGSGALISPYCCLTAGHCVYNHDEGHWNHSDIHIQPAAHLDGSDIVYPYGTRIGDIKSTNTKFADSSYDPKGDVDYGALRIICPFEELDTFMAVRFEYDPSFINMSGYPVEDLPDPSRAFDQWRGAGDVTDVESRQVYYDEHSTGGASGAPVWVFFSETDERYIVAVNRAHSTECDGIGCRLVSQNEDVIRSWMEWEPTFEQKVDAGCAFELVVMPFVGILNYYEQHPQLMMSPQLLNLVNPEVPPPPQPSARVMQVIGNNFYEWEEFHTNPQNPNSSRYLKMISPAQQWLPANQAAALLTASSKWVDEVPGVNNVTTYPAGPAIPFPNPLDLTPHGTGTDLTPDVGTAVFSATCVGDLTGDGKVNGADLAVLLGSWGQPGGAADLDHSGAVNGADLSILLGSWGDC